MFCRSYYSLRYGVIPVEQLVSQASEYQVEALCLTDINNTSGIIEFVNECKKYDIRAIGGIEFRNYDRWLYSGIAKNNDGFHRLNRYFSRYSLNNSHFPEEAPFLDDVYFVYPLGRKKPEDLAENEYLGVRYGQINRLFSEDYEKFADKFIYFNPATFLEPYEWEVHRHLRAIAHNTLLSQLKEDWLASKYELFYSPFEIKKACKNFPFLVENAEKIISECELYYDASIKNKKYFTTDKATDKERLTELSMKGMKERYGEGNPEIKQRIEKELNIIDELGFSAYFLITHDIIKYSMEHGYHHVGRGSGANSIVAYCLFITDVDPVELNLYFERFINPKRTSPPDFDIDYSWKERDYVLDYIFWRFGYEYTALLGAISTFKGSSILRELGKVYGLPKSEIDNIVAQPGLYVNRDVTYDQMFQVARKIADFPNIRTIHAGGVLISDKPITYYSSLDLPPKGYPTTHWDMYSAEDIGFEKLDILSQRGLGHIKEATEIIQQNHNEQIDIHKTDTIKQDAEAKKLLRAGETIGCFYIESPAMRGLLKKLNCDNYITLVAASSIIRPGVAKSGMMKEYIRRFHNPQDFSYIHPVMQEQLNETYGIMVYQEDVLKVCYHFAGLDLADADILRRAMSGKYRSKKEFKRIEEKFFSNCRERGYSEEVTREVWRQIESFAGYSFSKAHSASYAMESFQSLYLKAHYPLEFLTAVINNFGGFYKTWVYLNEAVRYGAEIELPSVNESEYMTRITDHIIYLGFVHIKGLERSVAEHILLERKNNGAFSDLDDFLSRTNVSKEQMIILIRTGAMRFSKTTKAELLWKMHMSSKSNSHPDEPELFEHKAKNTYTLPEFKQHEVEDAYDEIEYLGFPVTLSYFDLLKTNFRGELFVNEMMENVGKKVRMVGQLVTIKYVRTVKKDIMNFATFIDSKGEFFDTVHFPDSLKRYPFRGDGVYLLLGKIVEEFGYPSIEVEKMAKLEIVKDPREE
jgi:DNA polymerase-3 subunit alpha